MRAGRRTVRRGIGERTRPSEKHGTPVDLNGAKKTTGLPLIVIHEDGGAAKGHGCRNAKMNGGLSRVLIKKPATRGEITLIAFGQGHILATR
jgi:hypothetical protein